MSGNNLNQKSAKFLNLNQTKDLILSSFNQFYSLGGAGKYVPLILWGEKGIGKTSAVKQATELIGKKAQETEGKEGFRVLFNTKTIYDSGNLDDLTDEEILTVQLSILKLGAMQPFTVNGYPQITTTTVKDKKGIERNMQTQSHAMPKFLVDSYKVDYHVLFVDEVNRSHPDMHNAVMGLLDGDGINEHPIPENTFILAAANPPNENYGNAVEMEDEALLDRGIHVNVATSKEETLRYMKVDKTIDERMLTFLNDDNDRIQKKDNFSPLTGIDHEGRFHSDRSIAQVGRFIPFLENKNQLEAVAKGLLGNNLGDLLVDRLGRSEVILQPNEILEGLSPAKKKEIQKLVNPSAEEEEAQRLDMISKINMALILHFEDQTREELNETTKENLNEYLQMIPHDIREEFLNKATFTENENVLMGKEIVDATTEGGPRFEDLEFR